MANRFVMFVIAGCWESIKYGQKLPDFKPPLRTLQTRATKPLTLQTPGGASY